MGVLLHTQACRFADICPASCVITDRQLVLGPPKMFAGFRMPMIVGTVKASSAGDYVAIYTKALTNTWSKGNVVTASIVNGYTGVVTASGEKPEATGIVIPKGHTQTNSFMVEIDAPGHPHIAAFVVIVA